MNPEQMRKYMIGLIYEQSKSQKRSIHGRNKTSVAESRKNRRGYSVVNKTAAEFHISPGAVQKYSRFYRTVEKIRRKSTECFNAVLSEEYRFSHDDVLRLADMSDETAAEFIGKHRKKTAKKKSICITDYVSAVELWIRFTDEISRYIDFDSVSIRERQTLCDTLDDLISHTRSLTDVLQVS